MQPSVKLIVYLFCCILGKINFNADLDLLLSQVKVTPKHSEDCQRLLTLMGIPYIKVSLEKLMFAIIAQYGYFEVCLWVWNRFQAPCEAEAQCAELVKGGKVFATATEDMDALTFGSSILLRHLTASEQKY